MAAWREITEIHEWEQLWENSDKKPIVVLKHSTKCPVSANALAEFEAYLNDKPNSEPEYVLVKVIESLQVSNRIAEDTGVKHESPQIIWIKDKQKRWDTSHWSVTKAHMTAVLD